MNVIVVLPSLNPDEKLIKVVEGVLDVGFTDIIIVNDGSDNAHTEPFRRVETLPGVTVLTHETNLGKGRALKTAFEYCLKNRQGIDGVVTVDGDNQHTPEDILACARRMTELGGDCVVLGVRDFKRHSVPFKNFYGNAITSLVFRLFFGIRVSDTQTGLRAIPARYLDLMLQIEGERFEYETNMLLKFHQNHISLSEVRIKAVYIDNNATSHFRSFRDSIMIYRIILKYIFGAFTSSLIDYAVFALIVIMIGADAPRLLRISCAYIPARLISSVFNYGFNRKVVFHSDKPMPATLRRYYTLWVCLLITSLGLEYLVSNLLGATPSGEILIKIPVELFLFAISFRIQQRWVFGHETMQENKTRGSAAGTEIAQIRAEKDIHRIRPLRRFFKTVGYFLLVIVTIITVAGFTVYRTLDICFTGPSETARDLFVTTFLETGQLKFVPSMFLPEEEIRHIIEKTAMPIIEQEVDSSLIDIPGNEPGTDGETEFDINSIELVEISGRTFFAKMLIINDPSRVKLATTYPWTEYGMELSELVEKSNAIAGVNGGLYQSDANKGGLPYGIVVCEGEIQYNVPEGWPGLYLIGFDYDNILRIINIEGMSAAELERMIVEKRIRDAVAFQEEYTDSNNHFVQLIINGEERKSSGLGSGANPRTAIGQRADGAVLLLVTDGRGAAGHLGATAADLINIMAEYGAVNAANLDGGSSSCMYYNGKYEMTSVTLYYANSSWRLPTSFVVERR